MLSVSFSSVFQTWDNKRYQRQKFKSAGFGIEKKTKRLNVFWREELENPKTVMKFSD